MEPTPPRLGLVDQASTTSFAKSVEDRLKSWAYTSRPGEPPSDRDLPMLRAALPVAQRAAASATPEQLEVILDQVSRFALTFGYRADAIPGAHDAYRDALDDIPADVLDTAMRDTLAAHTDTFRLPLPGEIRERADRVTRQRRDLADKIGRALALVDGA